MTGNEERFWDDSVRFHALSWDLKSDPAPKKNYILSWHLCASISFHKNLQAKATNGRYFLGPIVVHKVHASKQKKAAGPADVFNNLHLATFRRKFFFCCF